MIAENKLAEVEKYWYDEWPDIEVLKTLEAALRVVRAAQEVHDDIFRITVNPDQHHENVMKLKEALAPFEEKP